MFEDALKNKIQRIFKLKRTEFWKQTIEQNVAFIKVDQANVYVSDMVSRGRCVGTISIYAEQGRIPHGYMALCIAQASPDDVRNISFYKLDESSGSMNDLDVRTCEFVFFFHSQYDPDQGIINEVDLDFEVNT